MQSPFTFIRQVRSELRKVVWPSRAQTLQLTLVTLVFVAILGLFFFIVDDIFSLVIRGIFRLFT